jgi:hypothetical protein
MAEMEENEKKAFDFAADLTKQLMTFATAILAFTATFGKEAAPNAPWYQKWCVIGSWVFYIFSIACGVLTLMALTGNLDPQPKEEKDPNDPKKTILTQESPILTINSGNVLGTSRWQFYFFILALALTAAYGYNLLFPQKADQDSSRHIIIVHDGKIKGDSIHIRDSVTLSK